MGWSGANSIFNPVARALINAGTDDTTKQKVLGDLINGLQEGDWDTEDESLEDFLDDPAIVAAFHDRGVHLADRRCCQQTAIQTAQDRITEALAQRFSDGAVEDRMTATPQEAGEVAVAAIRDLIGSGGEQR